MRSTACGAALLLVAMGLLVPPNVQAAVADWTFLIYLDADNNLESVGIRDFLEMASVGSTPRVNVIVQFDRSTLSDPLQGGSLDYGDWTTVKRFRVLGGMTPTPANELIDLGELDMADPATLVDFIAWGTSTYPARHYFLDLWDHGFGWPGVIQDGAGYMTTLELASALAQARTLLGRTLDIVGNDACRMTLEIMYELQPYVDYFVGSQKDEPIDGWPYNQLLAPVVANPGLSPIDVGSTLVAGYVASYAGVSPYSVTLSLVSSAALPGLVRTFGDFVDELNASVPLLQNEVIAARGLTEVYEGNEEFDLSDFAGHVRDIGNPRLARLSDRLRAGIDAAVLAHDAWDNPGAVNGIRARDARGLSIWFPVAPLVPQYPLLALSRDTGWDEFLTGYRSGSPTYYPITVAGRSIDVRVPLDGLLDTIEIEATASRNGTVSADLYQGGAFAASRDLRVTANESTRFVFEPPVPGVYVVSVLYYVDGKLAQVLWVASLAIQGPYRFQGMIRDAQDRPIAGAQVRLTNLRTNATTNGTSTSAGYALDVVVPDFMFDGDVIELSAAAEGRTVSVTFIASLASSPHTADLVLDVTPAPDMTPLLVVIVLLAGVAAILFGAILWQRSAIRNLRRRPGGP
ncbi:MAG TPA: clostripain-related cysteine peptidase [Thermoplasmata archaeon]|nr:clostripain-related cysteine peptidase [Thermoplasmata archaeon]